MSSEASFAAAMELCELAPIREDDPVRERERAETRRLWATLKQPQAAERAQAARGGTPTTGWLSDTRGEIAAESGEVRRWPLMSAGASAGAV